MTDHAFSIAGEESEHISILQCANCGLRINEAEYENYELLFGIKLPECKPKDEKQAEVETKNVYVLLDSDNNIQDVYLNPERAKSELLGLFKNPNLDYEGYKWEQELEFNDSDHMSIYRYKHPNPHYTDCPFRIEVWEAKE